MRYALWWRRLAGAIVLLLVAVAAALAVLPARWMISLIPSSWPVAVIDASGSMWRGQALVALGPPGDRTTLPQPVSWQTGWQNGPRLTLQHPWLNCRLALAPGIRQLGLSPCTLRLPATALVTLGAPLNTLKPAGELALTWPALQLPYQQLPASGQLLQLDWSDAGTSLSNVRPLGHYRVMLASDSAQIQVDLQTESGPFQLEGEGRWHPRSGFAFRGEGRPAPNADEATVAGLQTLLSGIGQRSGEATLLQFGRL